MMFLIVVSEILRSSKIAFEVTSCSTTNNVRTPMRCQFKSAFNSTFMIGIARDFTEWLARDRGLKIMVVGDLMG